MSSDVYAVIRTGGKQYKVSPGQRLSVERLDGDRGDSIAFDDVLLVRSDDGAVSIGAPTVAGASVKAQIVTQRRAPKINVFKYKNKTRYRRLRGHRQYLTDLRISEVALGDQAWAYEPPPPPAVEAPVDEAAPTDDADNATEEED